MKRRAYLAAAVMGLGGCTAQRDDANENGTSGRVDETDGEKSDSDDETSTADGDSSQAIEIIDDFGDLSRWDVLAGSLDVDRKRGTDGSQAAVLAAAGSDQRVSIKRELSAPLDCSTTIPGVSIAVEESVRPIIQLFDSEGDHVEFRRGIKGDRRSMRYDFGLSDIDGDPDLSAITEIRIALWVGDQSRTLRVDELFLAPKPDTGTVMIQFDDGYETDYTEALPILDRYGYPAVTFVNPVTIGTADRLDLAQCKRLRDAGWTVGNHTYSHARLENLTPDEQADEIGKAKAWLLEHGFERGARYFAYPFGEWDEHTLEIVDENHEIAFWGGEDVYGHAVNPLLYPRVGEPSAETAIELLERAAAWGGHVAFLYHELSGELRSDFESTIEHAHDLESAGEIRFVTPSDLETELAAYSHTE